MANKVSNWAVDWITGIMTCTIEAVGKVSTFDVKDIFPDWEQLTEIQKHCIYTGLKPKLEDSAAKEAALKQTPMERYASISNMWDRLTVDEVWSKKGDKDTLQKRMDEKCPKIISVSMAKFAVEIMKAKIGADVKVVSDMEYAELQTKKDEDEE